MGGAAIGLYGLALQERWLLFGIFAGLDCMLGAVTVARGVKTKKALDEFSYEAREELRSTS